MNINKKHIYSGLTVHFGTKHGKDQVIRPVLASLDMRCDVVDVETDKFGTFSGEVARQGTVRETLGKKIEEVYLAKPQARLALASEGSFGPHPFIGFVQSDHEALLLVDRELGIEIYAEELSIQTNHAEIEFAPRDNLQEFLDRVQFPSHAIIVRPKGNEKIVFKGLRDFQSVGQAIIDGFMASSSGRVTLSTDMRACFNPSRMTVIEQAGQKLFERLNSFCPSCGLPGFAISRGIPGLPCEACSEPSSAAKEVVWECVKCPYVEMRPRPDGKKSIDASECEICNP
jgi:ribosomal protein S27AE